MINDANWITVCCCIFQSGSWFVVGKCGIYRVSGDLNKIDHERVLHVWIHLGLLYHLIIGYVDSISGFVILSKDCALTLTVSDFKKTLRSVTSWLSQKHRKGLCKGELYGIVGWLLTESFEICRFNSQMAKLRFEGGGNT